MLINKSKIVGKLTNPTVKVYPPTEKLEVIPLLEEQLIKPDGDIYGFSEVKVDAINIGEIAPLQDKNAIITEEEQNIVPDDNIYGLSKVNIPGIKLQEKHSVPSNEVQEVIVDSNYDALKKVTIETDSNLVPENIRKDKEIFGVLGTLNSSDPEPYKDFEIDPRWNWWDVDTILANDTENYPIKIIVLYDDSEITLYGQSSTGRQKVITSDGKTYTGQNAFTHTWDASKDRQAYSVLKSQDGSEITQSTYKTRYAIYYYNSLSGSFPTDAMRLGYGALYFIAKGLINTSLLLNNANKLKSFKLIDCIFDGANLNISFNSCNSLVRIPSNLDLSKSVSSNGGQYMFYNCYQLEELPPSIKDFNKDGNITSTYSMFYNCLSLKEIPLFNTKGVTNFGSMFAYCRSLKYCPDFDFSDATQINAMFQNCGLIKSPLIVTTNNCNASSLFNGCESLIDATGFINSERSTSITNVFNSCKALSITPSIFEGPFTVLTQMFYNCPSLRIIPMLDCKNVTTAIAGNTFPQNDIKLFSINFANINVDITLSALNLNIESLLSLLDALSDRTGTTSLNCKIGSTNLNKLSVEQKAIATNKNWILS